MSKKIKIPSDNIKNRLSDLFHSFMRNRPKKSVRHYPYVCDDDDDMDEYDLLWLMQQGYVFNGIDDDYDSYLANMDEDDDADVIWPPKKERTADDIYSEFWDKESRKSKHKHRKSKKARVIDITTPYSGFEGDDEYVEYEELGEDNGIEDGKEIYYYPDYHEKDNRLEFHTLKAFSDFCEENGYTVPDRVISEITFRRISHTCLLPSAREYGLYEIMAEESYGTLFYEVCECNELG